MDAGYQNTISGLLRKWGEMLANMAELRAAGNTLAMGR
jgi:hypothetical protein